MRNAIRMVGLLLCIALVSPASFGQVVSFWWMRDLGPPHVFSWALDINDAGWVAGGVEMPSGVWRAIGIQKRFPSCRKTAAHRRRRRRRPLLGKEVRRIGLELGDVVAVGKRRVLAGLALDGKQIERAVDVGLLSNSETQVKKTIANWAAAAVYVARSEGAPLWMVARRTS